MSVHKLRQMGNKTACIVHLGFENSTKRIRFRLFPQPVNGDFETCSLPRYDVATSPE
jgi:hypothetical protein